MTLGQSILSKTNLKRWIVKCKGDTKQNDLRFQSFLAMQHFTEQNIMWLNHLIIRIEFVATLISGVKLQLPFKRFMIHFIKSSFTTGCHSPFGRPSFFVTKFPFGPFVTKYFYLTVSSMRGGGANFAPGVIISVNLYV